MLSPGSWSSLPGCILTMMDSSVLWGLSSSVMEYFHLYSSSILYLIQMATYLLLENWLVGGKIITVVIKSVTFYRCPFELAPWIVFFPSIILILRQFWKKRIEVEETKCMSQRQHLWSKPFTSYYSLWLTLGKIFLYFDLSNYKIIQDWLWLQTWMWTLGTLWSW